MFIGLQLTGRPDNGTKRPTTEKEMENLKTTFGDVLPLFDTVFAFCPAGIAFLDTEFRYVRVNPYLAQTHGLSPEAHVGKTVKEIVPNLWQTIESDLRAVLTTQQPIVNREVNGKIPDGSLRYWLASYYPVCNSRGEVLGLGAFIVDITDRKRAQQELSSLTEDLKRSNEQLEQFAYLASHDLKEPLRSVATYLQLLNRTYGPTLEGKARDYLTYAVDGASRMNSLIDGLLRLSRVGVNRAAWTEVALEEVYREVVEGLKKSITENGAIVEASGLPHILGDREQIAHLFQNLISNAIKFRRPDQPPHIRIRTDREGDHWIIAVNDNGIGIPESGKPKLFKVFSRLHRRDQYPGEGIGLALSKKIVECHQGRIWVESDAKNGSTFYFTLPRISPP